MSRDTKLIGPKIAHCVARRRRRQLAAGRTFGESIKRSASVELRSNGASGDSCARSPLISRLVYALAGRRRSAAFARTQSRPAACQSDGRRLAGISIRRLPSGRPDAGQSDALRFYRPRKLAAARAAGRPVRRCERPDGDDEVALVAINQSGRVAIRIRAERAGRRPVAEEKEKEVGMPRKDASAARREEVAADLENANWRAQCK